MLTYENVVAVLLGTIERNELNIAYTQELLDTHALGRSLSITCLPDGVFDDQSPQEPTLRGVVAFRWSPEFTVFSLRGADSFENIERLVDEQLFARGRSGPSLDIDVTYHLPIAADQQRDVNMLPISARVIHDLHTTIAFSEEQARNENIRVEPLRVDGQVSYSANRGPRLTTLTATRTWSIDEALYDADLLADTFEQLCSELHAMLELLAIHYNITREDPNDPGDIGIDRRYFKPPTA